MFSCFHRSKKRSLPTPISLLVLSGSHTTRPWTSIIEQNHRQFCALHQITYQMITETHPTIQTLSLEPYWSKIVWLLDRMKDKDPQYTHVVWIDDDIVITSRHNFLKEAVEKLQHEQKEVLILRDAGNPSHVNTGLMIFSNSPSSLHILKQIFKLHTHRTSTNETLGTCKNQSCLHEQDAFHLLLSRNTPIRKKVLVMLPREGSFNLNTFYRKSHYDPYRQRFLHYDQDAWEFRWKVGDHTAHCTGMEPSLRLHMIHECLKRSILYYHFRLPFL